MILVKFFKIDNNKELRSFACIFDDIDSMIFYIDSAEQKKSVIVPKP